MSSAAVPKSVALPTGQGSCPPPTGLGLPPTSGRSDRILWSSVLSAHGAEGLKPDVRSRSSIELLLAGSMSVTYTSFSRRMT